MQAYRWKHRIGGNLRVSRPSMSVAIRKIHRVELSAPYIHNASHVHRVNAITRLSGVKHALQAKLRMTFTHGRVLACTDSVSNLFPLLYFQHYDFL